MTLYEFFNSLDDLKDEAIEAKWREFVMTYLAKLDADCIKNLYEDGVFNSLIDAEGDDAFGTDGVDV